METLKQLLVAISSQDPRGLINAERQLKLLEIQPGFHAALLVCIVFFVDHFLHMLAKNATYYYLHFLTF